MIKSFLKYRIVRKLASWHTDILIEYEEFRNANLTTKDTYNGKTHA